MSHGQDDLLDRPGNVFNLGKFLSHNVRKQERENDTGLRTSSLYHDIFLIFGNLQGNSSILLIFISLIKLSYVFIVALEFFLL